MDNALRRDEGDGMMTMYVYEGANQIGRITAANRDECLEIFEEQFGSNDFSIDSHGDDLCAVEFEFPI